MDDFFCKCLEEDSPESQGICEETMIGCDICGKWWHGACARLSDETVQKFIEAGINILVLSVSLEGEISQTGQNLCALLIVSLIGFCHCRHL